ncbi:hypothetical protein D082_22310 [Synechocystis sp. PCC 6714]|nr:hypothetical protein D082_22310 [Synechocystis sp. PCC 6714]
MVTDLNVNGICHCFLHFSAIAKVTPKKLVAKNTFSNYLTL